MLIYVPLGYYDIFGANNKYLSPPDLGWMENQTKSRSDSVLFLLA